MKPLFNSFLKGDGGYKRAAGILIHISSLPGDHGIGDIGLPAKRFIDFLAEAGQRYWQFLPLGPTSSAFHHSPYMALSAFAGNPLLIGLDPLVEAGLLSKKDLEGAPEFSPYFVEFSKVKRFKQQALKKAFQAFLSGGGQDQLDSFAATNHWACHYAHFMAIREYLGQAGLLSWPEELRLRDEKALERMTLELASEIRFHLFTQWAFDEQWKALRRHARKKGISLVGDIPIYVGLDSADVWTNPEGFHLERSTLRPIWIAGVPPDYFSPKGQLWGNPVYRWKKGSGANEGLYTWWRERLLRTASLVDVVRIDHFRGFQAFWRVRGGARDARDGQWTRGPGISFFRRLKDAFEKIGILAEDLGTITPDVERLLKRLGFPGMKVLQFAFDSGPANPYLPQNYASPNCVVYTGTHDNDTCVGWYLDPKVGKEAKAAFRRHANSAGDAPHLDFIRLAYSSVAALAVIPMQDVLGFGSDCRMNTPSVAQGNWVWRCAHQYLSDETASFLREWARFHNRSRE